MIHVGIVTYDSLETLPACFQSLFKQSFKSIKVYVFDNASRDETVRWTIKNYPQVKVIQNDKNVGFGLGHNQIIQACHFNQNDYYFILNPDVILKLEYLKQLKDIFVNKKVGWATGKLFYLNCQLKPTNKIYSVGHAVVKDGYAFNIGNKLEDQGQFNHKREIFGSPATAMLISYACLKSILSQYGYLFDPKMFMFSEDIDLDFRLRLQGWRCFYEPYAIAYHLGSIPTSQNQTQTLVNRFILVIKNAFLTDLIAYNLPLIIIHLIVRLVITPKTGLYLFFIFLKNLPWAISQRSSPKITRKTLHTWFKWSKQQPTSSPTTKCSRLKTLLNNAF